MAGCTPAGTPSSKKVAKALQNNRDLAALLITRLVGIRDKEVSKLPANDEDDRGNLGNYDHAWQETSSGYNPQYRVFTLDTRPYDAASGEMIWSLQSRTMDASTLRQIIADPVLLAIDRLGKHNPISTGP